MNEVVTDIPVWMSIVFTVLCCLVTILIGWQIYQSINLEKKLRRIRKETRAQFSEFDKHVASSICLALGKISMHSYLLSTSLGKTSDAINQALLHVAQAFENINSCSIKDNVSLAYEALDAVITEIEHHLEALINIESATINRLLRVVMSDNSDTRGEDKIEVLNRLIRLQHGLEALKA